MVDRLEELLAALEEEEDEDEWEDALAVSAVPAPPNAKIETAQAGVRETALEKGEDEKVPFEAGELDWTLNAEVSVLERREEILEADDSADSGMAGQDAAEEGAVFWLDGLAEAVMGPNGSAVLRRPGAGDVELSGQLDRTGTVEMDAVMRSLTSEERGLETLYRQTVQASQPAAQAAPMEQAGRTMRAEKPGRTAALTVEELDRAVRRDSRRYDGGMTLF